MPGFWRITMNDFSSDELAHAYTFILERSLFAPDPIALEVALSDAADLGRELLRREIPPEELAEVHHLALINLAEKRPDLKLREVVAHLSTPLIEAMMAYSLAFRERLERRSLAMVNARLEQSRRLEAIGTLAAGIAHDFNNILGAIAGFGELLQEDMPEGSGSRRHASLILQASSRARDLVARMLTFAREMPDEPVPVEIVSTLQGAIDLLRASLPPGTELVFEPSLCKDWILAEPSQIQQIIMNLCINAADALPEHKGRILVRLKEGGEPGYGQGTVCLRVEDNGEGMSEEVTRRVFDPFFTTKAPGKGSGLGLSVVHGIVGKLGGSIKLSSQPGQGTAFVIQLPRIEAPTPIASTSS
jgi:signal transduction histidine kinase